MIQPQRGTASSSTQNRSDFSAFDGQRIAVVMDHGGKRFVWRGDAHYVLDEKLGHVLRVSLDDPMSGSPAIVIAESDWDGRVIPDLQYGCKYCLIFSAP
jgi:hypothetical protein